MLQQHCHICELVLLGSNASLKLRIVLQSLVELFTNLGYLSLEVFDELPPFGSEVALRFSIVCAFPLELSLRQGIDTSRPYSKNGKSLRCRWVAGSFLGLACRGLGRCIAIHDAYSGFGGGKRGNETYTMPLCTSRTSSASAMQGSSGWRQNSLDFEAFA